LWGIGGIAHPSEGDGSAVLLGVNTLNLDAKGRLAIPAKHRDALAQCCASRLVVTVNPIASDRCIWIYPENEWHPVVRQLVNLPTMDPRAQAMKRLMLGYASEVELDGQGRIPVSAEQRTFAGLDKRVSLVGQINKFELWDEAAWQSGTGRWQDVVVPEIESGQNGPLSGIAL
jgi:MraZ protein